MINGNLLLEIYCLKWIAGKSLLEIDCWKVIIGN
jgi:hypothetical protein